MKILAINPKTLLSRKKIIASGLLAFIGGLLFSGILLNLSQIQPIVVSGKPLLRFASYTDLVNFVSTSSNQPYYFVGDGERLFAAGDTRSASADSYSTTNIQVAGVDEADIVKSDGRYLYIVSNQTIYIVKAFPTADAGIVSKIEFNAMLHGLFVNGDRLVVFGSNTFPVFILDSRMGIAESSYLPYTTPTTFIRVYDISDKAAPQLARNVTLDGYYYNSRMIGNYVYTIINEPTIFNGTEVKLPTISVRNETEVVPATEIYYTSIIDYGFTFTTIVAVNIKNDSEEPTHETILMGSTRTIYVSQNNIYVAFYGQIDEVTGFEKTLIYRIQVDGGNIETKASGAVLGSVLNQFSMDEHNSYFRIATTIDSWNINGSRNNVYVLNMSLSVVGRLENLALSERIYSARFMGDKLYLVTFRQVDPFFVIDLSNSAEPTVLGFLKIPGFSTYLHPYDDSHIIGIGREGSNVKMSLFDVSNVSAPTELAYFAVEGDWSDSAVLWDHRAFLFEEAKGLLALPVSVSSMQEISKDYYSSSYWQGAYVFDVSLEQGFVLRGGISHLIDSTGWDYRYQVQRVLYIENALYTVSDAKVMLNDLDTLVKIGEVMLV